MTADQRSMPASAAAAKPYKFRELCGLQSACIAYSHSHWGGVGGGPSLVMWPSSPLEDWPLQHASDTSSSAHSKFIHAACEVSEFPASPDVKDVEDHCGLLPRVAGVLAAVGDDVLLIWAEVHQSDLPPCNFLSPKVNVEQSETKKPDLAATVEHQLQQLSHEGQNFMEIWPMHSRLPLVAARGSKMQDSKDGRTCCFGASPDCG